MTRLDLGSFLGLTLETVSRALSRFDEAGLIRIHQKNLQILNVEKLRQIVEHSRHLT